MTKRDDTIQKAVDIVNAAIGRHGQCPEGAEYFFNLWFKLEKEAKKIIAEPQLTKKKAI